MDVEQRVDALLAGPTACTFLLLVQANGLDPVDAASPSLAFDIAAETNAATNPWATDDVAATLDELQERARRLRPLARELATTPASNWWWAGLDRRAQHEPLWKPSDPLGRDVVVPLVSPTEPPSSWERYAQKSRTGRWTSTVRNGRSAMSAAIARGVGDYLGGSEWSTLTSVVVPDQVPVREIHSPYDWHALCVDHPAVDDQGTPLPAGGLVPDWSAVAREVAGVHVSFGGFLTTHWRTVTSDAGSTTLWAWHHESTHWIRDVLVRGETVPFALDEHEGTELTRLEVASQFPTVPLERKRSASRIRRLFRR